MKRLILFSLMLLLFGACKTQRSVAPFVLRDSISITYKQGTVQPLSISNIEEQPSPSGLRGAATSKDLCNQQGIAGYSNEQPTPTGVRGAAIESRKNSMVSPLNGETVSREGAKVFEGLLSQRTNNKAVPLIRVDTLYVERWHTTEVPSPPKPIPRFYKDCTWGFFILLLLTIGRIALKIWKRVLIP